MRVEKTKLHPLARAALLEIQASGIEVTPDMVLWLHDAASRIAKAPMRPIADIVDWPVMAGGVALYPLTFGAIEWLMQMPERMRNDVRVIAYAAAHSRDSEKLASRHILRVLTDVSKWALTLKCSMAALSAAVDQLLDPVSETVEIRETIKRARDEESVTWGAVVRALCTKYPGTSGAYWTWQVSRDYAYEMIRSINAELPEECKVTDYEVEMNVQFRSIVEHIKSGQPDICGECGSVKHG